MKKTFLLLLSLTCSRLCACTCGTPGSPEVAFEHATAVFIGRVVRAELVPREDPAFESLECAFEPQIVFKGESSAYGEGARRLFVVRTGRGGGDCGFRFQLDDTYLVYAFVEAGSLATNICTRTNEFGAVGSSEVRTLEALRGQTEESKPVQPGATDNRDDAEQN